jgi:hypothetical protein
VFYSSTVLLFRFLGEQHEFQCAASHNGETILVGSDLGVTGDACFVLKGCGIGLALTVFFKELQIKCFRFIALVHSLGGSRIPRGDIVFMLI